MTNFIIRRVFQSFLLLFFISILIYVIINLVPGGPFDMLALSNPRISQSHIDRLNALLDLAEQGIEQLIAAQKAAISGDRV